MVREDRYYARSWALLTRDSGWVKPLLVMSAALTAGIAIMFAILTLAASVAMPLGAEGAAVLLVLMLPLSLVPSFLVGLGINGYALEWARLTAWEVDAAPKQRGVRIGECVRSGWRGLVAMLGYGVIFSMLQGVVRHLFANSFLSGLVTLALLAASLFMSVVYVVVSLRATIYQRIGAGYKLARIWDMISRDPVGLVKIAGVLLVIGAVGGCVIGIVAVVSIVPTMAPIALSATRGADGFAALTGALGSIMVWLVIISFVGAALSTFATLIGHTAVALWMRQFSVPLWGASDDPLPNPGTLPSAGAPRPDADIPLWGGASDAGAHDGVDPTGPATSTHPNVEPFQPDVPTQVADRDPGWEGHPTPAAPGLAPHANAPLSGSGVDSPSQGWPSPSPAGESPYEVTPDATGTVIPAANMGAPDQPAGGSVAQMSVPGAVAASAEGEGSADASQPVGWGPSQGNEQLTATSQPAGTADVQALPYGASEQPIEQAPTAPVEPAPSAGGWESGTDGGGPEGASVEQLSENLAPRFDYVAIPEAAPTSWEDASVPAEIDGAQVAWEGSPADYGNAHSDAPDASAYPFDAPGVEGAAYDDPDGGTTGGLG